MNEDDVFKYGFGSLVLACISTVMGAGLHFIGAALGTSVLEPVAAMLLIPLFVGFVVSMGFLVYGLLNL